MKETLEEHVRTHHGVTPVTTYLRQIVYGGTDGIVTTFAVVAGFTGAQSGGVATYSILTVLLFGLANLFADGTSMAVGDFLSSRSEVDVYKRQKKQEQKEIEDMPEFEKDQTIAILISKGFSKQKAKELTEIYASNKEYWLEFMMNYELQLPNIEDEKSHISALTTFVSFLIFGFIPLIPYLFIKEPFTAFTYSGISALMAMVLIGLLRWYITKQQLWRAVGETVLLATLSAAIAYIVGTFFSV